MVLMKYAEVTANQCTAYSKIYIFFTSIFLMTNNPSTTLPKRKKQLWTSQKGVNVRVEYAKYLRVISYLPKTTCFPSNQSHLVQVMKNWQPLVPGPLFAYYKIADR